MSLSTSRWEMLGFQSKDFAREIFGFSMKQTSVRKQKKVCKAWLQLPQNQEENKTH
jgi:hypothetical protein